VGEKIRFQGGERAGKVREFDDEVKTIVIGRDPNKCQVVLPPEETKVGREHCALKRVLGRYRLQLNRDNLVLVDGKTAVDDQELDESADLQLGPGGPKLVVETEREARLEPTVRHGRRPGLGTMIRGAVQSAERARNVAIVVLLLLAVVGVVTYWRIEHGRRQRAKLEKEVTTIGGQVDALAQEKEELERLREAARRATPSVYLVCARNKTDTSLIAGGATAWVIRHPEHPEGGVLATNAHVAEDFNKLPEHIELIVRSNDEEPRDFVVKDVEIHPGYKKLNSIWEKYRPSVWQGRAETVEGVASCDVALLHVEPKDGLADPLPIASPATLGKLGAGDLVCFVGYPMEGIVLINPNFPQPKTQIASIVAVTDYFGAKETDQSGQNLGHLVQHALPLAAGASGSPVLNPDGEVVAVVDSGTVAEGVPSAVLVNFAQRADLLRELGEGIAHDAQVERAEHWEKRIETLYLSYLEVARRDFVSTVVSSIQTRLNRGSDEFRFEAKEISHTTGTLPDAGGGEGFKFRFTPTLEEAGILVVVAFCKREQAIDLSLLETTGPTKDRRHSGTNLDSTMPWGKFLSLELTGKGSTVIEGTVSGDAAGANVDVSVYQMDKTAITPDERRREAVDFWERYLKLAQGQDLRTEQVFAAEGVPDEPTSEGERPRAKVEVALPAWGSYLAIAIAPDREDIDLAVAEVIGRERRWLADDTSPDSYPVCQFEVDGETKIEAHVLGGTPSTKFELNVYRAVPVAGE